jgi:nucleotide-binding universal stress UspA family protein
VAMHPSEDNARDHAVPDPTVPRHVIAPLSEHWDTQRALPIAIWLAARAHASVVLVSAAIDVSRVAPRRAELERIADELRARGVEVSTVVRRSDEVAATIVDEARQRPGAVICMPTHGPGRFAELAIGTVTQDVVDHAPGAVVLVGPHVAAIEMPVRLVAAVDDTPPSARALSLVDHWARTFGLGIELVEVLDERTIDSVVRCDVLESATLHGYATGLRAHGIEPSWEVLHGRDRSAAIVDHVRAESASLLVVATHARHGIPRLVQGSVAMQIVHRSPVPVVVVR